MPPAEVRQERRDQGGEPGPGIITVAGLQSLAQEAQGSTQPRAHRRRIDGQPRRDRSVLLPVEEAQEHHVTVGIREIEDHFGELPVALGSLMNGAD